jgi:hypothetical protein
MHNPTNEDDNCAKFAQHILKVLHHYHVCTQHEKTAHTKFTVMFMMYVSGAGIAQLV